MAKRNQNLPKKAEGTIQDEIELWCGQHDIVSIRINVGSGYTKDGRWFTTGAPNGHPDLYLLPGDGVIIYVETKTPIGKLRQDQKVFHAMARAKGYDVIVPRSLEQFVEQLYKCPTLPKSFYDRHTN